MKVINIRKYIVPILVAAAVIVTSITLQVNAENTTSGNTRNVVTLSTGTKITSTASTICQASYITNMALMSPKSDLFGGVGVTTEMFEKGYNVVLRCEDSLCGLEAKKCLQNTADSIGAQIASLVEITVDIEKKDGTGGMEYVKHVTNPLIITMNIPESWRLADRDYAIICLNDGNPIIMADLDVDLNSVTYSTKDFGVCALVYGPKGTFDAYNVNLQ